MQEIIQESPIEQTEDSEDEDMEIEIPNLPRGKLLTLYVLSSWGDSNYIGLNGLEFWNREGKVKFVWILHYALMSNLRESFQSMCIVTDHWKKLWIRALIF